MHLALDQPLPPSAPAPTQGLPATNTTTSMSHRHPMSGMHMEQ